MLCCAGCGSAASDQPKLLVYCGAGIRPPVAELAELFGREQGAKVECDYAGSEVLLSRIKLTGRGDLYMPGDLHYVELAEKAGLIASKKTVCYLVPVILVQKGNPKNIRTLADLTRPGLRVGLGNAKSCAVGRQAEKIIAKNRIPEDALEENVRFRSLTVDELGNQVKLKMLDAVIVWDATAAYFSRDAQVVPIPAEQNVISTVAVAVLQSSEQPELAGKLADFLASARGKEVFSKHRYSTQSREPSTGQSLRDWPFPPQWVMLKQ